jgi:hypothetical protein
MRQRTVVSAALAGAAIAVAAGAATLPRAWRRLRGGAAPETPFEDAFEGPFGDPEGPYDPEANAALRDELRDRVADLEREPEAPPAVPVEPDLVVEGAPGADPALETARARLRQRADAAREGFRG